MGNCEKSHYHENRKQMAKENKKEKQQQIKQTKQNQFRAVLAQAKMIDGDAVSSNKENHLKDQKFTNQSCKLICNYGNPCNHQQCRINIAIIPQLNNQDQIINDRKMYTYNGSGICLDPSKYQ